MTLILGIDPGSRVTGYGLVAVEGIRHRHTDSGCIRLPALGFPERLRIIFESLRAVIERFEPQEVAIEQVFVNRNAASALKLGQARGAAICAAVTSGLPVSEYTPAAVKKAVVGGGRAEKAQVQYMIRLLLGLPESPPADAADALAVAICHAQMSRTLGRFQAVGGGRRWQ